MNLSKKNVRGGRGGYRPKKEILAKNLSFPEKDNLDTEETIISNPDNNLSQLDLTKSPQKNEKCLSSTKKHSKLSNVNSCEDDLDLCQNCDFCGSTEHRSRFCTVLNFNSKKSANSNLICYYCKQPGHYQSKCPKKFYKKQQKNQFFESLCFNENSNNSRNNYGKKNIEWSDCDSNKSTKSFKNNQQKQNFVSMSMNSSTIKSNSQINSQQQKLNEQNAASTSKITANKKQNLIHHQILSYTATGNLNNTSDFVKRIDAPLTQKQPYCRSDSDEYSSDSITLNKENTVNETNIHLLFKENDPSVTEHEKELIEIDNKLVTATCVDFNSETDSNSDKDQIETDEDYGTNGANLDDEQLDEDIVNELRQKVQDVKIENRNGFKNLSNLNF